jgi:hypothetical protein
VPVPEEPPRLPPPRPPAPPAATVPAGDLATARGLVEALTREVETRRGLALPGPVGARLATRNELAQLRAPAVGPAPLDERIAELLGMPTGAGLPGREDLLAAVVAPAAFDPERNELALEAGRPAAAWYGTAARELCAAAERASWPPPAAELASLDARLARAALVQGSATLFQQEVLSASSDLVPMIEQSKQEELRNRALLVLPLWHWRTAAFPVFKGAPFVLQVRGPEGWKSLDRVWKEPPVSTEQVLHPKQYGKDFPVAIRLPDFAPTLGEGWTRVEETLGELGISVFLEQALGEGRVERSPFAALHSGYTDPVATGWDGDRLAVYGQRPDGKRFLAWSSAWDSEKDAEEFVGAMARWIGKASGAPLQEEKTGRTLMDSKRLYLVERREERVLVLMGAAEGAMNHLRELAWSAVVTVDPREAAAAGEGLRGRNWTSVKYGFDVSLPSDGWEFLGSPAPTVATRMRHAASSASVTISAIAPPPGQARLEQMQSLAEARLGARVSGFKKLSSGPTRLGDVEAVEVRYTGMEAEQSVQVRQVFLLRGKWFFTVAFSAPSQAWDGRAADFQAIEASFKFRKPEG